MNGTDPELSQPAVRILRIRWGTLALSSLIVTLGAYTIVANLMGEAAAYRWILIVGITLLGGLTWLWRMLPANVDIDDALYASFGPALWVTIGRGLFLIYLAGLLVAVPLEGRLLWLPACLYATVAVGDYLDGPIARAIDRTTPLGARLDTELDALGILVASVLGVLIGQLPIWYLLAGIARYAFVAGIVVYRTLDRRIYPLPADPKRRYLAGLQMGFLVVALLPITGAPVTTIGAAVVLIPFLIGFGRDWLAVTGWWKTEQPYRRLS